MICLLLCNSSLGGHSGGIQNQALTGSSFLLPSLLLLTAVKGENETHQTMKSSLVLALVFSLDNGSVGWFPDEKPCSMTEQQRELCKGSLDWTEKSVTETKNSDSALRK